MDVNYCLHREQVERLRAAAAASDAAEAAHLQLAALYRARVDDYRTAVGTAFAAATEAGGPVQRHRA